MNIHLDTNQIEDYRKFLAIKRLPIYSFSGAVATFPDEYASRLGVEVEVQKQTEYVPSECLFDYQADITRLALEKEKFAVFADCGLGKTLIFLDFARHVVDQLQRNQCVLIVSPLMVIDQTLAECKRFYGDSLPVDRLNAKSLQSWLDKGDGRIGITNYDALKDNTTAGRLGAMVLDESSMLKSMYGKHAQQCLELGKGLRYKLALTGTPAPNDRIEYANHAVWLDQFPTTNAFLARYFVNKGQTSERWVIKPHAVGAFYQALSHWSIFLCNPRTYGWTHNAEDIPPIHIHQHHVDMTEEQQQLTMEQTGSLFAHKIGGIANRASLASIAKGWYKGKRIQTHKPAAILDLVNSWPEESTIIWCLYNEEQLIMEEIFPDAASIKGATPYDERMRLIGEFKAGRVKVMISKPKVLGFGLNLQIATRQVFSGLQDSYESFYQAVKRSNRIGSTRPLNVHIPITDIEMPMVENVLRKANRVQQDTEEQERIFCNERRLVQSD